MPIDINGYTLQGLAANNLGIGTSGTVITSGGNGIIDPMLPGTWGQATLNGAYKCYPFPANSLAVNTGSPWNTSTYRFTCPVAGIYYISYGGIVGVGSGATYGYYAIIINGANAYFSYHNTNNTWELHHQELMYKLSAGDTIAWAFNMAPAPDAGTTSGAYQSNHNMITIWLIG